ncbi:SET domain-containing protein [Pseudoscourfieldia marina]
MAAVHISFPPLAPLTTSTHIRALNDLRAYPVTSLASSSSSSSFPSYVPSFSSASVDADGDAGLGGVCPPGLAFSMTPGGNGNVALTTSREFARHDVLLIETCALSVQCDDFDEVAVDAQPETLVANWDKQVYAYANADEETKQAVMNLFALDVTQLPGTYGKALQEHIHVVAEKNGVSPEDATRVVLKFVANAVYKSNKVVLPLVSSRANHSCDANAVRVIDFPKQGLVTLYATEPLGEGDEVLVDYTAEVLWSRPRRIEWLRRTKCFDCTCRRCKRPDYEGALVCPRCLPYDKRGGGFQLPHPMPPDVGCIVRDPPTSSCCHDDGEKKGECHWTCGTCGLHISETDLDVALPAGPAKSVLKLEEYASSLAAEMDVATGTEVNVSSAKLRHVAQAACYTVGPHHWASHAMAVAIIRHASDASISEIAAMYKGVRTWLRQWAQLRGGACRWIGHRALLKAADRMRDEGGPFLDDAREAYTDIANNVPPFTELFRRAVSALEEMQLQ